MNEFKNKLKNLMDEYHYGEARKLIKEKFADTSITRNEKFFLKLKLAECYYKDNELNKEYSFEKALNILDKLWDELSNESENFTEEKKECKNLQGAVYKRYFDLTDDIKWLQKSISCYEYSWRKYRDKDKGYGGCNAANLYDILANIIEDEEIKNILHNKAENIRKDITKYLKNLKELEKWDYHTLITAYFGLGEFHKVRELIKIIKDDEERDRLTTYKTCINIAFTRKFPKDKVRSALEPLFGREQLINFTKTGLALSGGGFRASFFHLGTLAALAEADKLKDIEVISTVSGGSIIGVLYYLKIKEMVERKSDEEIKQEDYLKLVNELILEFFEGVKCDIRNRLFFLKGFQISDMKKLINFYYPFSDYNRVKRVAELYHEIFYSKYGVRILKDLIINPKNINNFKPRFQNFKRKNKVPIIVINATNLNNGHNFQFHATKMGESEYESKFDRNFKVSWLRDDCEVYNEFLISDAVAASSAVPGIFPALKVKLKDIELNLIDGGVFENIGLNALFCENCEEIIVSDAGYEMDNLKSLGVMYRLKIIGIAKYMHRTIDVLMDVNKDLIYEKLNKNCLLNILADEIKTFTIDCHNTKFLEDDFYSYFAKIRTDLDSFTKEEAYSIMYLAYIRMKEKLINRGYLMKDFDFKFKEIESLWESEKLKNIIKEARKKFFRRK